MVKKYNYAETNRMVVNNSQLLNLKFLYAIGLVSLENKLNYSGCLQANAGSHHWVVTINR